MRRIAVPVLALLLLVGPSQASAQRVEDFIGRYVGANGEGYLGPLADFLGAALNSGWARSAKVEPGFSLKLSLVGAGVPIADSRKTFTGTTDGNFAPQTSREVPTIFGDNQEVVVQGNGGTSYVFAPGLGVDMLATVVPQLSIGSIAGTSLSVRYAAADVGDDLGKLSLMGAGLRHDLGRYLKGLPVDLALGAYWQSFELGDAVETTAILASLHASRSMGILTLYGGVGYEKSNTDIHFEIDGQQGEVDIALDAENTIRGTAGLSLKLAFLELFADYSLASQHAFTIGLGLGK